MGRARQGIRKQGGALPTGLLAWVSMDTPPPAPRPPPRQDQSTDSQRVKGQRIGVEPEGKGQPGRNLSKGDIESDMGAVVQSFSVKHR